MTHKNGRHMGCQPPLSFVQTKGWSGNPHPNGKGWGDRNLLRLLEGIHTFWRTMAWPGRFGVPSNRSSSTPNGPARVYVSSQHFHSILKEQPPAQGFFCRQSSASQLPWLFSASMPICPPPPPRTPLDNVLPQRAVLFRSTA